MEETRHEDRLESSAASAGSAGRQVIAAPGTPGDTAMDRPAIAARVAADTPARYDPPAIALHWLTALLILTLWTLAQAWSFLQRGTPTRLELQALHVSLGLALIVVLVLRIGWRLGPSRRLPPADTGVVELAARGMYYLLYALLLTEVVLGLCFRWSSGDPLGFFGLFTIPSPYAFTREQRGTIGELHQWVGNGIVILAALHGLAALFHQFWLRDGVLLRMLPGRRACRAEAAAPHPDATAGRAG
jgi:cytochrome b561